MFTSRCCLAAFTHSMRNSPTNSEKHSRRLRRFLRHGLHRFRRRGIPQGIRKEICQGSRRCIRKGNRQGIRKGMRKENRAEIRSGIRKELRQKPRRVRFIENCLELNKISFVDLSNGSASINIGLYFFCQDLQNSRPIRISDHPMKNVVQKF